MWSIVCFFGLLEPPPQEKCADVTVSPPSGARLCALPPQEQRRALSDLACHTHISGLCLHPFFYSSLCGWLFFPTKAASTPFALSRLLLAKGRRDQLCEPCPPPIPLLALASQPSSFRVHAKIIKKGVGVASFFLSTHTAHSNPSFPRPARLPQSIASPHKQHQTHHKTKAQQQASLIRTGTMPDAKEAWQVRSARAASLSRPSLSVLLHHNSPANPPSTCVLSSLHTDIPYHPFLHIPLPHLDSCASFL